MSDFVEFLQQKKSARGKGMSALTRSAYALTYSALVRWYRSTYNEDFSPELLTNYDLAAFRRWCIDVQHVAPATWNARRAGLAAICEWIGEPGLMDGILGVDESEPEIRWLDDNEFGRLVRKLERLPREAQTELGKLRALRERAMTSLMLFAGLRVGEVAALKVEDVEIGERSGKIIIRHGKGDKWAEVPFVMLTARKWVAAWIEQAGLSAGDSLFGVTTRTAQRAVSDLGREIGIADLSAHSLRHTFLKRTLDGKNSKGGTPVALQVVQKLARHTRLETTLRYVQPSWNEMESAVSGA